MTTLQQTRRDAVMALVAQGKKNSEIAAALGITANRVSQIKISEPFRAERRGRMAEMLKTCGLTRERVAQLVGGAS